MRMPQKQASSFSSTIAVASNALRKRGGAMREQLKSDTHDCNRPNHCHTCPPTCTIVYFGLDEITTVVNEKVVRSCQDLPQRKRLRKLKPSLPSPLFSRG